MRGMHTLLMVSAILLGCTSTIGPDDDAAITGLVVSRESTIGDQPVIHVKETPRTECGIVFTMTADTESFRRTASGRLVDADHSDVTLGNTIRVWSDGTSRSCPGQATALRIHILD